MRRLACCHVLVCLLACLGTCGCGGSTGQGAASSPAGTISAAPWMGIPSAVTQIIGWIHEGTGWVLNKNQVSVVKVGDVRPVEGAAYTHVADFRITVSNGASDFETTATEVPCDRDGIPTEDAVTRLREAVEDIKAKIKRLQI